MTSARPTAIGAIPVVTVVVNSSDGPIGRKVVVILLIQVAATKPKKDQGDERRSCVVVVR